jgi:hypothetical protein
MNVAYEPPPTASANTSGVPHETYSQMCVLLLVFARSLFPPFHSFCADVRILANDYTPSDSSPPCGCGAIFPIEWRIFADTWIVV